MAKLKKYDLSGEELTSEEFEDSLLEWDSNGQMFKDYMVAIRNNKRQWSASTKGRSEVSHSGAKPHPQKGTGRARQGSLVSPQYKGGGIVFGPKPKFNQHVKINQKERRAVINTLLAEGIKEGALSLLSDCHMDKPQTKAVAGFLNKLDIRKNKILFVCEAQNMYPKYESFAKSMRNLKKVKFLNMNNINGYELANADKVFVMNSAIGELKNTLGRS